MWGVITIIVEIMTHDHVKFYYQEIYVISYKKSKIQLPLQLKLQIIIFNYHQLKFFDHVMIRYNAYSRTKP